MEILDLLNRYANLITALITLGFFIATWRYVSLTGQMVAEMKAAREEQFQPHLIATLIPLGREMAKIRIQNAGSGPALGVAVEILFEPVGDVEPRKGWLPALLSN